MPFKENNEFRWKQKGAEPRTATLNQRITPSLLAQCKDKAKQDGYLHFSDWVIEALADKLNKV